jgi:hypothetical protein
VALPAIAPARALTVAAKRPIVWPVHLIGHRWFPLAYFLVAELIFLVYEVAVPSGIGGAAGVASGLLLMVVTLPFGLAGGPLQWYAAQWMGYGTGDTQAFWPRFIAFQLPLLLNVCILLWLMARHRAQPAR